MNPRPTAQELEDIRHELTDYAQARPRRHGCYWLLFTAAVCGLAVLAYV